MFYSSYITNKKYLFWKLQPMLTETCSILKLHWPGTLLPTLKEILKRFFWQTIVFFQFLHQKGKLSKLLDYLQNICPDLEVFVINLWKCLFMYIPLIFDSLKVTLAWTVIVYLLWAHLFHCNDLKKTFIFRQSRKNDLVLKLKALLKPTLILVLR